MNDIRSSLCIFAEICGNGLALEHDGSLYSCDHCVYPEYNLGNINETPMRDLLWTDRQRAFGRDKADKLTAQCRACQFRYACNGGCPRHRFAKAKDGEEGHNFFCESYTMFFRHAGTRLQDMAKLIAAGRPAAEAVRAAHPERRRWQCSKRPLERLQVSPIKLPRTCQSRRNPVFPERSNVVVPRISGVTRHPGFVSEWPKGPQSRNPRFRIFTA